METGSTRLRAPPRSPRLARQTILIRQNPGGLEIAKVGYALWEGSDSEDIKRENWPCHLVRFYPLMA